MKKLILLNSKIEDEIVNHFEDNFEITEPKTDFECKFKFNGWDILAPYTFENGKIEYQNNWIGAEFDGKTYSTEDSEHFEIRRKAKTLQDKINDIMEYKKRKQIEIDESAKAIQLDQELMRGGQC